MEKKQYFQMEFKEVEVKEWSVKIKWFASTPDIDRYNDIVLSKAFKSSLDQYMKNPVVLLQHDGDKAIGRVTEAKIKTKGLYVEAEITNNIDNVFENITNKVLWAFSIWFIPKKWEYKEENGVTVRVITDLDLIENSVVSTPANANALFTLSKSIKSFFDKIDEKQTDNILDTNTESMKDVKKEVEVTEEVITEEATEEVTVDGTDTDKVLDEVENADENSAETTEEEKDVDAEIEAPEEVAEEEVEAEESSEEVNDEDETKEELKSMKQEIKELKAELSEAKEFISNAVEWFTNITETLTKSVNSIPVRKGLVTMQTGANQKSVLGAQLEAAQKNII